MPRWAFPANWCPRVPKSNLCLAVHPARSRARRLTVKQGTQILKSFLQHGAFSKFDPGVAAHARAAAQPQAEACRWRRTSRRLPPRVRAPMPGVPRESSRPGPSTLRSSLRYHRGSPHTCTCTHTRAHAMYVHTCTGTGSGTHACTCREVPSQLLSQVDDGGVVAPPGTTWQGGLRALRALLHSTRTAQHTCLHTAHLLNRTHTAFTLHLSGRCRRSERIRAGGARREDARRCAGPSSNPSPSPSPSPNPSPNPNPNPNPNQARRCAGVGGSRFLTP